MVTSHYTLSKTARPFAIVAALFGATGVAAGAYASHGLSAWASAEQVGYVQLAVTYQLFHSITLLVLCVLSAYIRNYLLLISKIAFTLGILLFSGSLYCYVLLGSKLASAATPVGGLLLIIAWLLVALAVFKKS